MKRHQLAIFAIIILSAFAVQASPASPTLTISAINVSSSIIEFPLTETSWAIQPWETAVGHLEGTTGLGQNGNVVLAGHSRMPDGKPGIFSGLHQLSEGNEIIVFDGTTEHRYVVSQVFTVQSRDVSVVFPTSNKQLTLITCDTDSYDKSRNRYNRRVVVVANPVS